MPQIRSLLLLPLLLLFAGCFGVETAIITRSDAVAVPIEAGTFTTIDKETKEKHALIITRIKGEAVSYRVVNKEGEEDFRAVVHFTSVSPNKYVAQIKTDDDDQLMIMAAFARRDKIIIAPLDSDKFAVLLQRSKVETIKKTTLFADHSKANQRIEELQNKGAIFAVETFGFQLHGEPKAILNLASEMVKIADFENNAVMVFERER